MSKPQPGHGPKDPDSATRAENPDELSTDEGRISLRVKVPAEDGTAVVEMTGPAVPDNGLQAFGDWLREVGLLPFTLNGFPYGDFHAERFLGRQELEHGGVIVEIRTRAVAPRVTLAAVGAKLASLKGVVWVGVVMFVFGLASLFYPPLKLIVSSVTTSVAITAGGVALMILPSLIAGNELLILGGVAAAVGVWFFAHRHGQLRGLVDASKTAVGGQAEAAAKIGQS